MIMNKSGSRILLVMLIVVFLAPICLWVLSMCGFDVSNPLSEEGLRALFMHGATRLVPQTFGIFFLAFNAIVMSIGSGLALSFRRKITLLQRRGRNASIAVLLVALIVFMLLYIWPDSPVLSLSGHFKHSPLIHGMPLYVCFTLMAMSTVYSLVSRRVRQWYQLVDLLCYALHHYTVWFYILLILVCLYTHLY